MRKLGLMGAVALVPFLAFACSGGGQSKAPDQASTETEFRYAFDRWAAIQSGQLMLTSLEVGEISHEKGTPVATSEIKYSLSKDGKPSSKKGTFLFRQTESGWQIYDRDLQNPKSSTAFQLNN